MQPVLKQTDNYKFFELHKYNRDVSKMDRLIRSMRNYGFRPHKSIDVIKHKSGKLIVTDGHHRLLAAMELNIPVWYTLADDVGMSIQEEQETTKPWDLKDFLVSYVRNGSHNYIAVQDYVEETGIPLNLAISLLAGESAGSANKSKAFKQGRYVLGNSLHAHQVKSVVLHMKKCGVPFASNTFFVQAISKTLWVEEFSISRFKKKISSHAPHFEKQPNIAAYLGEIEKIYNRSSKDKIPVAFLATENAKQRQDNFGVKK